MNEIAAPARRRRVALWNAAFGYATLAFTLARNLLLVPLYLQFVSLGEYGAWLATGGALVQLLVTDYGLAGVVTQKIAMLSGSGDRQRLRALIAAGLINAVMLAIFMTAASSLLAAFLPATQGLAPEQVARVVGCFLIAIAANGLGVVSATTSAALRGLQKPITAGAIGLGADAASIAVTLGCLFAGLGLYGIAFGLLARSLIAASAGLVALTSFWLSKSEAHAGWRWADSLEMWRDGGKFFITSIAMRLQSQANILLVGTLLGPQVAAIYGLTVRAHETVAIVMSQLNSALGPVLAHLEGAGQRTRLDGVIRTMLPVVAAIAAGGAVCAVVLNESFVGLWVGPQAYGGFALSALMGLALWISAISYVAYEALLARGEFSYIARAFAAAAAFHLLALFCLLPFGAWAAPLALAASSATWGTVFWRRVIADMRISAPDSLRLLFEPVAIVLTAIACGVALLLLLPHANTWSALAIEAVVCVAAVGGGVLLARPPLRRLLRDELLNTLRSMRAA
jgi:O-antigen/teichoic acid export membrane protein